jgi:hypothetical protein
MSLAGEGAVAIWHDIAPEGREEFYAWHGEEHMPERVGIPGFLRGRRYVAIRAELEFFNLYEASSPQVVIGVDYRARLENPTPWTVATVKHFRSVARSVCRVAATYGRGQGGLRPLGGTISTKDVRTSIGRLWPSTSFPSSPAGLA